MRIYRELSRQTGGTYNVILDDVHLKDLLHAQLEPPPSTLGTEPTLIKMGFPCHTGMMRLSGSSYKGSNQIRPCENQFKIYVIFIRG